MLHVQTPTVEKRVGTYSLEVYYQCYSLFKTACNYPSLSPATVFRRAVWGLYHTILFFDMFLCAFNWVYIFFSWATFGTIVNCAMATARLCASKGHNQCLPLSLPSFCNITLKNIPAPFKKKRTLCFRLTSYVVIRPTRQHCLWCRTLAILNDKL